MFPEETVGTKNSIKMELVYYSDKNIKNISDHIGKFAMDMLSVKKNIVSNTHKDKVQKSANLLFNIMKIYATLKHDFFHEEFQLPNIEEQGQTKETQRNTDSPDSLKVSTMSTMSSVSSYEYSNESSSDTDETVSDYEIDNDNEEQKKAVNIMMANAMITRKRERQSKEYIYIEKN